MRASSRPTVWSTTTGCSSAKPTICEAGYDNDLRDVPEYLLEMLENTGICMGELEERLMVGDTVYGA